MSVTSDQIKALKAEMPCKWKPQTANEHGCTLVAYVDARQVSDQLDEILGPENWASDYKEVSGSLFAGIGILTENGWVWRWDAGTESDIEAEKGEASDAFKRAAVKWGLGRFLYNLKTVKTGSIKDGRGKWQPADENGQRIWDCTEYVARLNGNGKTSRYTPKQAAPAPQKAGYVPRSIQAAEPQASSAPVDLVALTKKRLWDLARTKGMDQAALKAYAERNAYKPIEDCTVLDLEALLDQLKAA